MNGDCWDSPYEVGRRVREVNNEGIVPGKKSEKKIFMLIHANNGIRQ